MRILHLLSQRPDSTGSGIYLQEMLEASRQSGNEDYLVAGVQNDQIPSLPSIPLKNCSFVKFQSPELPLPIIGMSDAMPYASGRFRDLSHKEIALYENIFAKSIASMVADCKPHLIHSHHLWLLSSLAARMFPQIPMVTSCHGSDLRQFRNCPHLQSRVLSGCRHIPRILALSEPQKGEISELYSIPEERITVVGGGYNPRLFYEEKKTDKPVRLLYAGKLSNAKGVPWLLRALTAIDPHSYHLDLIGGGDGCEFENCLALAAMLGSSVTVHGPLSQDSLAALLRQAHIMVLPSFFEGLPLIMLEAAAAGCRIVATDLQGTREIATRLDTDAIRLIPCPLLQRTDSLCPENELTFIRHIREAVQHSLNCSREQPNLPYGHLKKRIDYYSWPQVFARVEQAYQQIAPLAT